jgi:ligand-binding SRPBCC domain-containing protein
MEHTGEKAIAGQTTGLIELGQQVTWQARHLGKNRHLTTRITEMVPYRLFTDEMVAGDFRCMKHRHRFEPAGSGTVMTDDFYFESPYGIAGRLFNLVFLTRYMKRLLTQRNKTIQRHAEKHPGCITP